MSSAYIKSVIDPLARQQPKVFGLPPTLADNVRLDPESIKSPDILTLALGFQVGMLYSIGTGKFCPPHHLALAPRLKYSLEAQSATVNRSITQDELNALVEDRSRTLATSRSGAVWGVEAAFVYSLFVKRSQDSIKPYVSPEVYKTKEINWRNLWDAFNSFRVAEPLAFSAGCRAWGIRLSIAGFVGWVLAGAIAQAGSHSRLNQDPRLEQFRHDFVKQDKQKAQQRRHAVMIGRVRPAEQMGQQAEIPWSDATQQNVNEEPAWNTGPEPSPSAGLGQPSNSAPADTGSQDKNFLDDDASPIAPEQPSESAWSRIRTQSLQPGSSGATTTQTKTNERSSSGGSQHDASQGSAWDRVRNQNS